MLARAEVYNSRLSGALSMDHFRTGGADPSEEDEEYNAPLNINGVMGYIDIPKIDVYLPVYHGTSAEVLKKGAGHLYGSALPTGGSGTHSVISAHRGRRPPGFYGFGRDGEGDIFYFHIFDRIMKASSDRSDRNGSSDTAGTARSGAGQGIYDTVYLNAVWD